MTCGGRSWAGPERGSEILCVLTHGMGSTPPPWGQHNHPMLVWMSSMLYPKHPLSSADPGSYFNLHVVSPACQQKGEGDCGYLAKYNQACSGQMGLVCLGEGNSDNKRTGMRGLACHLGEGSSDFKPMVRRPCWHCSSLLGHGCSTSCFFLSRGAQFVFSGIGFPIFLSWFSTTFLNIVVEVMTSGLPQVCKPWLGVCKDMLPVKHLAPKILTQSIIVIANLPEGCGWWSYRKLCSMTGSVGALGCKLGH